MDFYDRKAKLSKKIVNYLRQKEEGSKKTWPEFCREMTLELGVPALMCKKTLELIEPRLTIKNNQITKNDE